MKSSFKWPAFKWVAFAACLAVPLSSAEAHRTWMLPSATVLSGEDPWVTVDAAISNDIFFFEHHPMRLDSLQIFAPDGSMAKAENEATGKYRSTFDLHLVQKGTYKIAIVNDGLNARYKENGQPKRWRGTAADFVKQDFKKAEDLQVTQSQSRIEVFVTAGQPGTTVFKPTNAGLELVPVTHPNDLYAGEAATFQFLLDGKPAENIKVTVIPDGIRYRDQLNEIVTQSGKDGKFSVTWPNPGMYWLQAAVTDDKSAVKQAKQRRASYSATLEVMPQ